MKRSKISAAIVGAALSVGGLALAPVHGAAQAAPPTPSTGLCTRLVGVGHHYAVVAYPCPLGDIGQIMRHHKQLPAAHETHAV